MINLADATPQSYKLRCEECEKRFGVPVQVEWFYNLTREPFKTARNLRKMKRFFAHHIDCGDNEVWGNKPAEAEAPAGTLEEKGSRLYDGTKPTEGDYARNAFS